MAKTASSNRGDSGRGRRPPMPVQPGQQRTPLRKVLKESWGELRKVQWPTRKEVAQGTIVVGLVTAVFALYLTSVDFVAVRVVKELEAWLTK